MIKRSLIVSVCVLVAGSMAAATQISDSGTASFTSDLNPNGTITLDSFNTNLGTLNWVKVEVWHTSGATIAGDNDDPVYSGDAQARVIRTFDYWGPGISSSGGTTLNSGMVTLAPDNGDGAAFDSTGPDGYSWAALSYTNLMAGAFLPVMTGYMTAGPGSVVFTVDPTAIVNDLNWVNPPQVAWQLQVENDTLDVKIKVTYDYTAVPEPASLSLLGLGLAGLVARRRKA